MGGPAPEPAHEHSGHGHHGPYGVLHFLSELQPAGEGWQTAADLGSAPAEAREDLLWRLSDAGAAQATRG